MLLLETMLAFPDKEALLGAISRALPAGGRFAFTLEEGLPLDRARSGRACPTPTRSGSPRSTRCARCSSGPGSSSAGRTTGAQSHRAVAEALIDAFAADATAIAAQIGRRALDELLAAHRLWSEWLETGRVRKIALVAETVA